MQDSFFKLCRIKNVLILTVQYGPFVLYWATKYLCIIQYSTVYANRFATISYVLPLAMLLRWWIKQCQNIFNKDVENSTSFLLKDDYFFPSQKRQLISSIFPHKLTKHFFDFNRRFKKNIHFMRLYLSGRKYTLREEKLSLYSKMFGNSGNWRPIHVSACTSGEL